MGEGEKATLHAALADIRRAANQCLHQKIGRWDMKNEDDRRCYGVLSDISMTAHQALERTQ